MAAMAAMKYPVLQCSTMFHREYMGYEPLVNWDARPSGEQLGYEKLDFAMDIVDTWKWIHGRTPFANNS